jgi:chromate transport protein ChrA
MGLIHNLLMCAIHLLFVAMDILVTMILIKVVYERWRPEWLRQINETVEPLIVPIMAFVYRTVKRITGKSLSEKHLILVVIASLCVARFVIDTLL